MEDSRPGPTQFAAGDTSEANILRSKIVTSLRDCIPDSQAICVTVFGGTIVLRGRLSSAQDKRLCLECCRQVPGVIRVIDELVVTDEGPVHFDPEHDA